ARLLYPARRDGVVRVGKDHLVEFLDKDISPEPLRFLAHHFTPGDEFEAVCNPMVPDLLFIYDARPARRGSWIGVLQSWGRVSRADHDAVMRQVGRSQKVLSELRRPLVQLGDRLAQQRADDLAHNNKALGGAAADSSAKDDAIDDALSNSLK
ncbi:MAG: hypothetical protein KGL39_58175, partial [Patescibacteria group bacterium]|nr:hypothetical protein [Patescibacteria group bacterium]